MTKEFVQQLLKLYPEFDKVTGPYLRKDGRQHICLNNSTKPKTDKTKRKTLSYPKAIKEVELGYRLYGLTVDHIDKNPLNNEKTNLQILTRKEHAALDCIRRKEIKENCIYCGKEVIITHNRQKNRNQQKAGPFCSRQCSGKYGTDIQNNRQEKLPGKVYKVEYYCNKK